MKKNRKHVESISSLDFPKILRIMRLSCLLLMVTLIQVSASTYSQNRKINLNVKELSIREVFDQIEDQSEFSLFYNLRLLELNKKVNVKVNAKTVDKVLDMVLEGTDLTYSIDNKLIVIHKRKKSELQDFAVQQKRKITGKVIDKNGESLPGVSIVVKGTTIGIVTDIDGNYSIEVPADAQILLFSFVGMKTQEMVIDGKTTINITMEEESIGLDEVVAIG